MSSRAKLWFVTFLTFVRFPLVLVFVVGALAQLRHPAGWLFVLSFSSLVTSAVTDLLDGYYARKFHVETRLGAHADPLMDKLFYLATLPLLVFIAAHNGHFPHGLFLLGITVFFLARDQWVTFLRSIGSHYNVDPRATWSGKVRTSINFPLICGIYFFEEAPFRLLNAHLLHGVEIVACVMNVVSLWSYTRRYWPYLRRSARLRKASDIDPTTAAGVDAAEHDRRQGLITMAAGVAHDYNNLLAAILGNATVVMRGTPEGSPLRKAAMQTEAISRRAVALTNRIQVCTGRCKLTRQDLDLSELVGGMSEDLRGCASPEVRVDFRLANGLPRLRADAALVREAVRSLVQNAADSIVEGAGAITVTTGADRPGSADSDALWVDRPLPGPYVFVNVADTGSGIPEAVLSRIFDPFFTTKLRGEGLGLATALGVMRAHAGAIRVSTEPGRGATFRLALPTAALGNDTMETGRLN